MQTRISTITRQTRTPGKAGLLLCASALCGVLACLLLTGLLRGATPNGAGAIAGAIGALLLGLLARCAHAALTWARCEYIQRVRLERVLEAHDVAWWGCDIAQQSWHFSPAWWRLLGYYPDALPADAALWSSLAHPDDAAPVMRMLAQTRVAAMADVEFDLRLRHKDGHYLLLKTRCSVRPGANADAAYASGTCIDLRERIDLDAQVQQARAILASTREGVMITDTQHRITLVNQAFSDISGFSAAEALGQASSLLSSGCHDARFYAAMWASIASEGRWRGEIWNRRKNGEVYPEILTISAVRDGAGRVANYVGVFADISTAKASESELAFVVHHDPLTRLPNRMLFSSMLEHAVFAAQRSNTKLAVLIIDLDRFKDLNDSYGHVVGDELLQQVAARLTARTRAADIPARLGGDEFAVLLENINRAEDAAVVAHEIIALFSPPWMLGQGLEVHLGASIGISVFPEHGSCGAELMQHADAALAKAKQDGCGCCHYFSERLTVAARERIDLESRLHRAIEQHQLRVYYQPQVHLASGKIIGAEALVRWQDPEHGLIAPSSFIPVAETSGLIHEIGAWVMRETCAQGQRWIAAGLPPLTLAVNLSPRQFLHGNVEKMVATILRETGFPADKLELELTESALMAHEQDVLDMLERLRLMGVRLAIDDFGTGYSSLSYLKRFPLDVLKIDKSFVDFLPFRRNDMAIAEAIIGIGHTLGFQVLAEGVENAAQLAFLSEHGCDLFQGYLRSPPLPAEAFAGLLGEAACDNVQHAMQM